jgi:hypothetical protein
MGIRIMKKTPFSVFLGRYTGYDKENLNEIVKTHVRAVSLCLYIGEIAYLLRRCGLR